MILNIFPVLVPIHPDVPCHALLRYMLKCHVDGLCETCQKAETIEHYLSSCKRFKNERNIMKTKLKIIDLNILNIFNASITDNYCALLSFIRNTKRFE